jgi:hypothetical protein
MTRPGRASPSRGVLPEHVVGRLTNETAAVAGEMTLELALLQASSSAAVIAVTGTSARHRGTRRGQGRFAQARPARRCRRSVAPRIAHGRLASCAADLGKISLPVRIRPVSARAHEPAQLSESAFDCPILSREPQGHKGPAVYAQTHCIFRHSWMPPVGFEPTTFGLKDACLQVFWVSCRRPGLCESASARLRSARARFVA